MRIASINSVSAVELEHIACGAGLEHGKKIRSWACTVRISTWHSGHSWRMRRVASSPSISGMEISMTITRLLYTRRERDRLGDPFDTVAGLADDDESSVRPQSAP